MLRRRPAATATARANQLTATVTGTISSGTDYLGTFFPSPPTNLAGKTYTIVCQMDDAGRHGEVRRLSKAAATADRILSAEQQPGGGYFTQRSCDAT